MIAITQLNTDEVLRYMGCPPEKADQALREQIKLLELRRERLGRLIRLAQETLDKGENHMDFTAFDAKELEAYAKEAKERWGGTPAYQEFQERAKGKPDFAQASRLMDCFAQLGRVKDQDPASPEVQKLVEALRQTISENFYTCTPEILRGLGEMYAADPRFRENIDRAGGPGAAEFASRAIAAFQ